ncbi:hypothetical protein NG99_27020 [Erwinia typographi]|uniref:Peptidase S1 domain-containing protein n=2 Tax=Erwinia typographi TaxID=371042 RepID=A0A0A3ZJZ9_9GAMM|nr:hypothetical protein NG99_27020 [Erwinia typographi]
MFFVNFLDYLGNGYLKILGTGNIPLIGTVNRDDRNHNNDDYAAIELDQFDVTNSRLSELVGGLGLCTETPSSLIGNIIYEVGYPADVSDQMASYYSVENTSDKIRAEIRDSFEVQVLVDAYSSSGDSGGPLIMADNGLVSGVIWGSYHDEFGEDGYDPDYIYRGISSSHLWDVIKDNIEVQNTESFTGLAVN